MRSSSAGLARPVRTEAELVLGRLARTCAIRSPASASSSSIDVAHGVATSVPTLLAGHYPVDVALVVHVEDVDRQPVLHAQRQRRGVHDAQPALQRLHVRDLGMQLRLGVRRFGSAV